MSVFDKWNKTINEDMRNEIDAYDRGEGGGFEKVPYGHYEVKIDSIEIKLSKQKQVPQMVIVWKILKGENENKKIWQFQTMKESWGIHLASETLRKLGSGFEIKFKDYDQFNNLCLDVMEKVSSLHLEYGLKFMQDESGYDQFEITNVFETE